MASILLEERRELRRNWGWLLALGIVFVFLGCIGLGMLVSLTLASMLFLGVLLLIGGFSQIIDAFKSKQWKAVAWHAFIAILYLIAGGLVLYDPFFASAIITALLASVLIIIGISRFFMAIMLKGAAGWGWLLFAGIIAFILGIMILMQWPVSGLWIIGLFIAIELLVSGWTYIFLALATRRA
ncbi:HdeD family acid-resistance protein [Legionella jordanis]|uniref:Acid-resistance membrane protein n=1 Tax=Legionella jordanis TaxID=456 RepID=A0A0W0VFR3_9GAMM|nr:HdeD family acid-resistance protein [Legionella jordanis]KTD18944.1 acid-resistance membrane protein [Legionella jordanis]RMX05492.1 HdeD family acid-resistance protein [Legionella jordanis]RMX19177.1 HdeD family acid-resistance protein [Legionella jordanis]VEH13044.1 HdeD protein [Legionella jordanis]HAT8714087.1 HdeD family acid-resistance protein [Legionella jordanis]